MGEPPSSRQRGEPGAEGLTRRAFLGLTASAALGPTAFSARSRSGGGARRSPPGSRPLAAGAGNETSRDTSDLVTLFLGGDVMTGRGLDQVLRHPSDPALREPVARSALDYVALAERVNGPLPRPVDFSYPWGEALDALERARPNVRIINLELVLMYFVTMDAAQRKLVRLDLVPLRIARFRLVRASSEETRWMQETLDRECARFGARVEPNAGGGLSLAWGSSGSGAKCGRSGAV